MSDPRDVEVRQLLVTAIALNGLLPEPQVVHELRTLGVFLSLEDAYREFFPQAGSACN